MTPSPSRLSPLVVLTLCSLLAACAPPSAKSGDTVAGCSLTNISFTKYGSLVTGSTLSEADTIIGCAHEVLDETSGVTTAQWKLSGAPNVYIEGEFDETNGLGSQSIVGIDSDTGRPRCTHAPSWPDCIP